MTADSATFFRHDQRHGDAGDDRGLRPAAAGWYYIDACTVVSSGASNWQTATALAASQSAGITGAPNMGGASSVSQTTPPSLGTVLTAITGSAADRLFAWTS